jgi:hypothetical protein
LERLDRSGNSNGDKGALALLTTLKQDNHTLTLLKLDRNAKISPALQKAVDFVLTLRLVVNSFRNCFHKLLEEWLMPLGFRATELYLPRETGAGALPRNRRRAYFSSCKGSSLD